MSKKKDKKIIWAIVIATIIAILVFCAFYYFSEVAVADDGIVSPIDPDEPDDPEEFSGFDGYWKQQILITYTDGSEEYVGAGIFSGTKLSMTRGGKEMQSMHYLLNARVMPSTGVESVRFIFDNLIIVLDFLEIDSYQSLIGIVSSEDVLLDTVIDDGIWHLMVKKPLDIWEYSGSYIRVSFDGFAMYQVDTELPVSATPPIGFTFQIDEPVVDPENPDPEIDYDGLFEITNIWAVLQESQPGVYNRVYLKFWVRNNDDVERLVYWETHNFAGHVRVPPGEIEYKWMKFSIPTPGHFAGVLRIGFSFPEGCPNNICTKILLDERAYTAI